MPGAIVSGWDYNDEQYSHVSCLQEAYTLVGKTDEKQTHKKGDLDGKVQDTMKI